MVGDAHYKADCYHICYQRRTAVAYQRQRYSRYGHKSYAHSDILKRMEQKHCSYSDTDISAVAVVGTLCDLKTAQYQRKQQRNDYHRADKTKFLTQHAEYKVGVLCRQISHLVLRSVQKSLAPKLP